MKKRGICHFFVSRSPEVNHNSWGDCDYPLPVMPESVYSEVWKISIQLRECEKCPTWKERVK